MNEKSSNDKSPRIWTSRGTTYVRLPLLVLAGLLIAVIGLVVLLWSTKRRSEAHLAVTDPGELRTLIPSMVGLSHGAMEEGNKVEVLQNGDGFFPRLMQDIAAARETVHMEMYIWWDGAMPRQLAQLLARKAREGVEVRLLIDASGGHKMSDESQKIMADAGVKLARYHAIGLADIGRMNNRDHRKIAVIDGRIGHCGGYGIADEWTGHAQDKKHWRDTGLRMEGPIVNRLQAAFSENWIETTGEVTAGERYFPRIPPAGTASAHIAYTSPSGSVSSVEVLYYLAIAAAQQEIILQNPYLLPENAAIKGLEAAVDRGVSVKVMVPSADATDNPLVQHASHHHFGTLLKRGVRIWEFERTLLHQKLMVVDGVWSCVGSTNFDARSFELNDEISVGVVDPAVAAQLRAAFAGDLRSSHERTVEEWEKRPLWHKLLDGLAYLAHEQL